MEISAIFFLLALLVLIGLYLFAPFMSPERRGISRESQEASTLMAERDRIINALQELDFDHTLGKVPAEDYPTQRADLLQKGADVLKQLDALRPSKKAGETTARIEKAAAARRADASSKTAELSDDDLESMLAARRKEHKSKSSGFCPNCGKPIMTSDRFCPSCGKALK